MKTIMVCQKVMRILILTLLFLNFAPCFGQDKMELVNNFMESMLKSNYSDTEIIHRFIKTDTTSTKSAEFAKSLIQYLRTDFTQKSIKANELSYIRYREAPESTQDMIISGTQNV